MATPTTARPQKVTMACLTAGVASVLVLISVMTTLSGWGSLEVREQVERTLDASPVTSTLSVDAALRWLRVLLMAAAALATASLVLAVWTAKRHKGARIGLTVVSVLSTVSFAATGAAGIIPAMLGVVVVVFLWSAESRAWFAGRELQPAQRPPQQSVPAARPVHTTATPPVRPPQPGSESQPPPAPRPYAAAPGSYQHPFPGPVPHQQAPYARPGQPPRPRPLITAVVTATVLSGIVAAVFGLNALIYLVSPSQYVEMLSNPPMFSDADVRQLIGDDPEGYARGIFLLSLALGLLAVAGAASALSLLVRKPAARIVFTVVAGIGMAVSVVLAPLGLIWLLAQAACVMLVWRREVTAWLRVGR
ncbi:proline-rich domain-containing protein [Mumia quercus]|uniref:proline-rich domain-containing protein n=1 Tax=Mumia quercus TaxID=2976125 RepID=UPI0021D19EEF|nr:proline-rich domain-containing protein [Mumia quercus]